MLTMFVLIRVLIRMRFWFLAFEDPKKASGQENSTQCNRHRSGKQSHLYPSYITSSTTPTKLLQRNGILIFWKKLAGPEKRENFKYGRESNTEHSKMK
mmetsp:Transcript_9676/g.27136  ORF Transcript_9676/g.27136 Transcript_9676/m.27136 type:complete len:98 (+) Transcript_9676:299-592(+)